MDIHKMIKAIDDQNRIQILEFLSCGELCACEILKNFKITQPTLSHHMKILVDAGLVNSNKRETKIFYDLNNDAVDFLKSSITNIFNKEVGQCNCSTK